MWGPIGVRAPFNVVGKRIKRVAGIRAQRDVGARARGQHFRVDINANEGARMAQIRAPKVNFGELRSNGEDHIRLRDDRF